MTDTESQNKKVIERLIQGLNDKNIAVMDEVFLDDAIMDWPQSGERIVGAENRRGIYGSEQPLPTITPRRMLCQGDLVVAEASLNYDGPTYMTVFIFELKDGKIAKETAYWTEPFPAPEWRSKWVEKLSD